MSGRASAVSLKSRVSVSSVWDSVWALVVDGELKVGDQLPPIRELADRLRVKASAVRDALLKGESMGMIRILPRTGAFLLADPRAGKVQTGPTLDGALADVFQSALVEDEHNLLHLLDARRLIEIELVGRGAERRRVEDLFPVRRSLEAMLRLAAEAPRSEHVELDIRFHIEIARLAGNFTLFTVQKTLMELLKPHLVEVPRDLQRRSIADRSHVAIYDALVAGDAETARLEMREHLSLAYDGLLRDLQEPLAVRDFTTPSC